MNKKQFYIITSVLFFLVAKVISRGVIFYKKFFSTLQLIPSLLINSD